MFIEFEDCMYIQPCPYGFKVNDLIESVITTDINVQGGWCPQCPFHKGAVYDNFNNIIGINCCANEWRPI